MVLHDYGRVSMVIGSYRLDSMVIGSKHGSITIHTLQGVGFASLALLLVRMQ